MFVFYRRRSSLALALAALLAAGGTSLARAGETGWVSQHVSASDLNLRTSAGQAELRHRVALAALKVCVAAWDGDLPSDCAWQARRGAQPQVDALVAAARSDTAVASAAPAR